MTKKPKNNPDACVVRLHLDCNGSGLFCGECYESEFLCRCSDGPQNVEKCVPCGGCGHICIVHESPCERLQSPPKCDKALESGK